MFGDTNGRIYGFYVALTNAYINVNNGLAFTWSEGQDFDTPGIYRPIGITYYLSNRVTNGSVFADITATYGSSTDLPIAGDWISQSHDGIGIFRPSNGLVYLKNAIMTGFADNSFFYGVAGDVPVAGHWQSTCPPIAPQASARPAPQILTSKTAAPGQPSGGIPDGNQIGG